MGRACQWARPRRAHIYRCHSNGFLHTPMMSGCVWVDGWMGQRGQRGGGRIGRSDVCLTRLINCSKECLGPRTRCVSRNQWCTDNGAQGLLLASGWGSGCNTGHDDKVPRTSGPVPVKGHYRHKGVGTRDRESLVHALLLLLCGFCGCIASCRNPTLWLHYRYSLTPFSGPSGKT